MTTKEIRDEVNIYHKIQKKNVASITTKKGRSAHIEPQIGGVKLNAGLNSDATKSLEDSKELIT